jgi:hypothetical protein
MALVDSVAAAEADLAGGLDGDGDLVLAGVAEHDPLALAYAVRRAFR